MSSASLILTDGGLALSERKAVGAQGSTKVLAASSLGSCLVFVSSAVVTVALAAIGRDMGLSPLDLQWVMNAELLPLAALTLAAGALGDRFGQKRIFLAGIALFGLGVTAIGFDAEAVAREFALAEDEVPVMLLSVGAERPGNWLQKPRRPVADVLEFA